MGYCLIMKSVGERLGWHRDDEVSNRRDGRNESSVGDENHQY